MTQVELLQLFTYTTWANHRVLETCATLPIEDLKRDFRAGHRSIFETLLHLFGAERIWFERWQGQPPQPFPKEGDYGSIAELADAWQAVELQRGDWLAGLSDENMTTPITYKNLQGQEFTQPLQSLMLHVVSHSTHHRGQVVAILRALGVPPPNTDYIHFLRTAA